MKLLICEFKGLKKTKIELKKIKTKNRIIVYSFSNFTPQFLSKEYYKTVRFLKEETLKNNSKIIFPFYIFFEGRKLVNGLFFSGGKIENVFGEGFSKKHLHLKVNNLNLIFLFYFELYFNGVKKQIDFSKVDLTVGLDDDEVGENLVFLDNKFFNKLVLIGGNGVVRAKNSENILKKQENVCEYNVQKI